MFRGEASPRPGTHGNVDALSTETSNWGTKKNKKIKRDRVREKKKKKVGPPPFTPRKLASPLLLLAAAHVSSRERLPSY